MTLTYSAFLAWRWAVTAEPPGLRSIAGMSSVAALWTYASVARRWDDREHPGSCRFPRREVLLLLVLATAIVSNLMAIARAVPGSETYPVISAVATLALIAVFRHVLRQIVSRRRSERHAPRDPRIA